MCINEFDVKFEEAKVESQKKFQVNYILTLKGQGAEPEKICFSRVDNAIFNPLIWYNNTVINLPFLD